MKLVQKGLLCILVTLLLEGSCAGILLVLHNQAQQGAQRVSRSKDRISVEDSAMAGVLDLTLCTVSGLAAGKSPKAKAQEFAGRISEDLYKLKQMPSKDQEQQKKIEEFENAVTELVNLELRLCDAVNDDGLELPYIGSTLIRGEVRKRVDKLIQIKRSLQEMESKEKLSSADSESLSFYAVASVVVVNMILLLALAFVFLRGIGARLSRIVANAHRFSKNEPLADPLKGKDEIAELDRSFHEMADIVKAATQKQRAMIENAVDVICSVNEFGAFTAVSPAAVKSWGFPPETLIGKTLADVLEPDKLSTFHEALTNARKSQETVSAENRVVTGYGTIRDMLWSVQWSESDASFFCVVHDISERKAIDRLKQDFVNMISHDLRTPLTAIGLTIEMLLSGVFGELNAKGFSRVTSAAESTQRLLDLINQLLDLEKLEAGKMEVDRAPHMVLSLLDKSCDSVRAFAEQHDVKLQVNCSETLQAVLDGPRIVQVLVNLISNACKFSPENSTVTVSARVLDNQLAVMVKDEGRGVPVELRDSIFDRFKQVERADELQKGGTGLGLAICKAIVEAHGGVIGVDSEAGKGSTFWFKIPTEILSEKTGDRANIHA